MVPRNYTFSLVQGFYGAMDFTLYPNPTSDGSIYIKSGSPLNGTTISIFNLQGQLVGELSAEGQAARTS